MFRDTPEENSPERGASVGPDDYELRPRVLDVLQNGRCGVALDDDRLGLRLESPEDRRDLRVRGCPEVVQHLRAQDQRREPLRRCHGGEREPLIDDVQHDQLQDVDDHHHLEYVVVNNHEKLLEFLLRFVNVEFQDIFLYQLNKKIF